MHKRADGAHGPHTDSTVSLVSSMDYATHSPHRHPTVWSRVRERWRSARAGERGARGPGDRTTYLPTLPPPSYEYQHQSMYETSALRSLGRSLRPDAREGGGTTAHARTLASSFHSLCGSLAQLRDHPDELHFSCVVVEAGLVLVDRLRDRLRVARAL